MSKRFDLTLIIGISGVGKSYLIKNLISIDSRFLHFSAGTLIKQGLKKIDRDALRKLTPKTVLQNQYVLINQFTKEVALHNDTPSVLFDAHMIIDTDDEVVEIPFDIFEQLKPNRIVYLYDEPKIIAQRRTIDSSRDRPQRPVNELKEQQDQTKKLIEELGAQLSVPIIYFSNQSNANELYAQIKR